jgi:hypothetical protein
MKSLIPYCQCADIKCKIDDWKIASEELESILHWPSGPDHVPYNFFLFRYIEKKLIIMQTEIPKYAFWGEINHFRNPGDLLSRIFED